MHKWKIILGLAVVAVGAYFAFGRSYLSRATLEVALRLDSLPKSIKNIHTKEQGFTDEIIYAYFEGAPDDLKKIIKLGNYSLLTSPFPEMPISSTYPLRIQEAFPHLNPFEVGDIYRFDFPDLKGFSVIWTDPTYTKAFTLYCVD